MAISIYFMNNIYLTFLTTHSWHFSSPTYTSILYFFHLCPYSLYPQTSPRRVCQHFRHWCIWLGTKLTGDQLFPLHDHHRYRGWWPWQWKDWHEGRHQSCSADSKAPRFNPGDSFPILYLRTERWPHHELASWMRSSHTFCKSPHPFTGHKLHLQNGEPYLLMTF